uniref:putative hemolysin n=1 Tax=Thaumasiovibrio occultus TaxID=1891184 RepID=UPI000B351A18|nr:DUF333 domain-containing protein [Thaumasiovibrio occultus]
MRKLPLAFLIPAALLSGCYLTGGDRQEVVTRTTLANPAAVFCVEQDGALRTVTEEDVRMTYCDLPNGESVEQWEYFRQNHTPDEPATAENAAEPQAAVDDTTEESSEG